jgi:hypothetical protein
VQVKNVIIWGNHSATQYPDVSHAYIVNPDGTRITVSEAVGDGAWIKGDFVKVELIAWRWIPLCNRTTRHPLVRAVARRGGDQSPEAIIRFVGSQSHLRPHAHVVGWNS